MRLLLVEDDQDLATWMIRSLEQRGIIAEWEEDGRQAVRRATNEEFDAIVLDLGLPGLDGTLVLEKLRQHAITTPLIVVTARHELSQRVSLLHSGADDFLAKPFAVEELEARLVALVRRSHGNAIGIFTCGSLSFNQSAQRFTLGDQPLTLTAREHMLLRLLIQRPGEPLSKQQILERMVNADHEIQNQAVEVMVYRLRKRLENSDVQIVTVRGLGYFLEAVGGEDG